MQSRMQRTCLIKQYSSARNCPPAATGEVAIDSKTVCVHFCRLRKQHADPTLTLSGKHIAVVEETRFLGFVFD